MPVEPQTDSTVKPPPTIPFMPQTPHPSTTDVEQMINSRVHNAVEGLREEFKTSQASAKRNREILIGVGGLVVGGVAVYGVNRIIVSRRARAAAMK